VGLQIVTENYEENTLVAGFCRLSCEFPVDVRENSLEIIQNYIFSVFG
jgi:hypothetical protein